MPSRVKALLDRTLPLSLPFIDQEADGPATHPQRFRSDSPRVVLISTAGFYTLKRNIDALALQYAIMTPKNSLTTIFCPMGELFRQPALRGTTDAYLEKVHKAGREYASDFRISPETARAIEEPLFPVDLFIEMANLSWGVEDPRKSAKTLETEAALVETASEDAADEEMPLTAAQREAFILTKGMSAMYRPESYQGKERILEMIYSDLDVSFKLIMDAERCEIVRSSPKAATATIETPWQGWKDISEGKMEGSASLMKGLYKVRGNFSFMMNWDEIFGSVRSGNEADPESAKAEAPAKTSFLYLLTPWIVFWAAAAAAGKAGAAAVIFISLALPLVGLRARLTVYDRLSALLTGGLSSAILMGVPLPPLMIASYALFGAMWLGSCLFETPITAYYSANGYGGTAAFRNPMFMVTNRILSAAWGVYYLLTSGFTYFLYQAGLGSISGLINSAGPLLMGAFTAWFQRWYPAKIARG